MEAVSLILPGNKGFIKISSTSLEKRAAVVNMSSSLVMDMRFKKFDTLQAQPPLEATVLWHLPLYFHHKVSPASELDKPT